MEAAIEVTDRPQVQWLRVSPFIIMHLACLTVFVVGWSWTALAVATLTYSARIFALTAFYHRYFAHRAFKTSRWFQFVGALVGNAAVQRGPIWWAAHHRDHHQHSDARLDVHSPHQHGFLWSHMLWFMTRDNYQTKERRAKDWVKFPELRFLDRYDFLVPVVFAIVLFAAGELLQANFPSLGVNGWQLLVWGFLVSTILVYHVTFSINSLAHKFGRRRFETKDHSRNNFWLAIFTFGEGWHNNHHFYPASARQGFYWWELDITYCALVVMSWFGLVWDLKGVPQRVLERGRPLPSCDAP
jgi:stearoyl-CoA desaturase (delta-9 desaturase)